MTEPLKHTARIKARGLDATGVTEDHARQMASSLGRHTMLIVEVVHDAVTTDSEGKQQVSLRMTNVEPVPAAQEDTVREFQRALYRSRPDVEGQAILSGTASGPTVADTASALSAAVEKDDHGNVVNLWDGSTDGPLTPNDAPCVYPGCTLPDDHDGDHDLGDDGDAAE